VLCLLTFLRISSPRNNSSSLLICHALSQMNVCMYGMYVCMYMNEYLIRKYVYMSESYENNMACQIDKMNV
jgi:hypothetical protein